MDSRVGEGDTYAKLENIVEIGLEAVIGSDQDNVSLPKPSGSTKKWGCNVLIARAYCVAMDHVQPRVTTRTHTCRTICVQ